ncbi:cytidylate kinase [Candidatus Bathyarchaeota archaeon]|nr:MAG: cytidylate kinase [Candidatus Bathyarchaeota archaeon]
MIVTVSGPHGSGKSTYAAKLAGSLGLRHVSAGMLFRKLAEERKVSLEKFQEMAAADPSIDRLVDERTTMEAERGDVVVDGQLAGWVLKEISDLRILLTAPLVVRLERIAARDHISLEEARRQTLHREAVQAERYRKHYGFSVDDWSIYHLILDTSFGSIEDTAKILLAAAVTAKNAKTRKTPEKNPGPQPIPAATNRS